MTIFNEIQEAEKRIRPYTLKTPLIESRDLSKLINAKVYLKMESEQYTGSFKARGSLNKLLSLNEKEKENGVITASTGNHALGFARASEIANVYGTVFLPENVPKSKIEALRNYKVNIKFHGLDCLTTEIYAKQKAAELNKIWISPYNDPKIIGGQGTIGIELTEQLKHFDYTLITIGGGGLMAGVGSYLKEIRPEIKLIGCQPENSPEMALSLRAGEIVESEVAEETLSTGSAGGIEEGSITFPVCQSVIDEMVLVSEREIASAIKYIAHTHHKIIEGAAGVAVASLLKNKEMFRGRNVIIVICGSNIDITKLKDIL